MSQYNKLNKTYIACNTLMVIQTLYLVTAFHLMFGQTIHKNILYGATVSIHVSTVTSSQSAHCLCPPSFYSSVSTSSNHITYRVYFHIVPSVRVGCCSSLKSACSVVQ